MVEDTSPIPNAITAAATNASQYAMYRFAPGKAPSVQKIEIASTIVGIPAITLKIYVERGETSRTRPVDCLAKSPAPPTSLTTILPGWTGGFASIAISPPYSLTTSSSYKLMHPNLRLVQRHDAPQESPTVVL